MGKRSRRKRTQVTPRPMPPGVGLIEARCPKHGVIMATDADNFVSRRCFVHDADTGKQCTRRTVLQRRPIECNGCGGCCDPVQSQLTLTEMRVRRMFADEFESANTDFALAHWTQLSPAEGMRRAPWFAEAQRGKAGILDNRGRAIEPVFYECDQYDRTTRQCLAYDNRPPVCSGYPWYGGRPRQGLLPSACEFRREIGETPVPISVMLQRRDGSVIA